MARVMIVHYDEGKFLDGEPNGRRVFFVLRDMIPICFQFTDEPHARRIALQTYDTASVPKQLVERDDDTGKETVVVSERPSNSVCVVGR
jgi:hypothetical protein